MKEDLSFEKAYKMEENVIEKIQNSLNRLQQTINKDKKLVNNNLEKYNLKTARIKKRLNIRKKDANKWICQNCGNINYIYNAVCISCGKFNNN